jgi:hypothetical protein
MAASISSTPSLAITYTLTDGTITETSSAGSSLIFPDGTGTGQVNIGVTTTGYISSGETIVYDFQKFPKEIWNSQILLDFTSTCGTFPLTIPFSPERGIKGLIVTNTWDASILPTGAASISSWTGIVTPDGTGLPDSALPRINIRTTGDRGTISGGFGQLFNSNFAGYLGTGNVPINPQSTWSFVDPVGKTPLYSTGTNTYMHTLQIITENFTNISGSGGLSSGTSGDAVYYPIWNDVTSGSPWSGNLPRMTYEILAIGVTG